MNGTEKLTVNYPLRLSLETFQRLQKIAKRKTWRMSDTVRSAIERGSRALEKQK